MTDKMSANKRTDEDPPWANLLKNVLWTVATIYDIFSLSYNKVLINHNFGCTDIRYIFSLCNVWH